MRLIHSIRKNPFTAFTVVVAALVVWVAVELFAGPGDAGQKRAAGLTRKLPPLHPELLPVQATDSVATAVTDAAPAEPPLGHGASVVVSALTKLRPGMTRAEVEQVLGSPAADKVLPLSADDGRLTYRTAYEVIDMDGPNTVRPIPRRPLPRIAAPTAPPSVVALEFDASRPGHPLVEVLYPDPLF